MSRHKKPKLFGILEWLKKTQFAKFISLIKKNPLLWLTIFAFDMAFMIFLFLVNFMTKPFVVQILSNPDPIRMRIDAGLVVILLFVLEVLAYSFFKYLVLGRLNCNYKPTAFNINNFGRFFKLNFFVTILVILTAIIFNLAMFPIIPPEANLVFSIFFMAILFFLLGFAYLFVNLIHAHCFQNQKTKIFQMIGTGIKLAWFGFGKLSKLILIDLIIFVIYLLCFALFGLIVRTVLLFDVEKISAFNPTYVSIFLFSSAFVLYVIFNFNRISLF